MPSYCPCPLEELVLERAFWFRRMSKPKDFKDLCDLGNAAQRATEAACQECVKRDASLETQPLCFLIYKYPYVDFSDVNGRPVWCFATLSGGFLPVHMFYVLVKVR